MKSINVTPRWLEILPLMLRGLKSKNKKTRQDMETELCRMAQAADRYNDLMQKNERGKK